MILKPKDTILKSYRLAVKTLQKNYSETGILAGKNHFSDLWIRDACFSIWGSLELNDFKIVKHSLKTILKETNKDGQVPLRYGAYIFLFKFIGLPTKNQPRYIEDKGFSIPTDSNSLFLIALEKYCSKTNDLSLITEHTQTIQSVLTWNLDRTKDYLINESKYAGWADSLNKSGKVLYTNILYLKSLESFQNLCALSESLNTDNQNINNIIQNTKDKINNVFWQGDYFIDYVNDNGPMTHFSTDGNILAILFDIANKEQSEKILDYILKHTLIQKGGINSCHPKYSKKVIYTPFLLINLSDYHNGLYWLWLSCLTIAALAKCNRNKICLNMLTELCNTINEHKGIFEVYEQSFKPVNRLFYKSEKDFSWSSGLFIWMLHQLKDVLEFDIESSI